MALGKGSGIFNLQFGGDFKRHRGYAAADEVAAQEALKKYFEQALGYQQPFYDYGQDVLARFKEWGNDPNAITSDPSYKWRVGQGTEALENSAAARGGLLSGNTGKALVDYGQQAGSQEYQNEFNRWLSKLGIGQGAAANMSNISTGLGNALSGLMQRSAENKWKRITDQANMTLAGEQATNNIVQSWVPAMYGGGNPGNTVQPSSSGGGGEGGGGGGGYNFSGYENQQPFGEWQNYSNNLNWGAT